MIKPSDPRQLTIDLMDRSICSVQVGAVIADRSGIVSWGWNSVGYGFGEHAEAAAIRRSNQNRLRGATIIVASQRKRNKKPVFSAPCEDCQQVISKWGMKVIYRDKVGEWWRIK